jgi:hypothetical protein
MTRLKIAERIVVVGLVVASIALVALTSDYQRGMYVLMLAGLVELDELL